MFIHLSINLCRKAYWNSVWIFHKSHFSCCVPRQSCWRIDWIQQIYCYRIDSKTLGNCDRIPHCPKKNVSVAIKVEIGQNFQILCDLHWIGFVQSIRLFWSHIQIKPRLKWLKDVDWHSKTVSDYKNGFLSLCVIATEHKNDS